MNGRARDGWPRRTSTSRTLVVVARLEPGGAKGVDGNASDRSVDGAGAVYVFAFSGATASF